MNSINSLFARTNKTWGEVNLNERSLINFPDVSRKNSLLDPRHCELWLYRVATGLNVDYTYGGYLENRSHLWRNSYLNNNNSVHLGVDINFTVPETIVLCPVEFTVKEIFVDTDHNGGWGGRVLLETKNGLIIFAHIYPSYSLSVGKTFAAGSPVGKLATSANNGGWFVHLHLQGLRDASLMTNLDGYGKADEKNSVNYPEPLRVLGIK